MEATRAAGSQTAQRQRRICGFRVRGIFGIFPQFSELVEKNKAIRKGSKTIKKTSPCAALSLAALTAPAMAGNALRCELAGVHGEHSTIIFELTRGPDGRVAVIMGENDAPSTSGLFGRAIITKTLAAYAFDMSDEYRYELFTVKRDTGAIEWKGIPRTNTTFGPVSETGFCQSITVTPKM